MFENPALVVAGPDQPGDQVPGHQPHRPGAHHLPRESYSISTGQVRPSAAPPTRSQERGNSVGGGGESGADREVDNTLPAK